MHEELNGKVEDLLGDIKEICAHMREIMYELKETVIQGRGAHIDNLLCPKCDLFFCEHQKP